MKSKKLAVISGAVIILLAGGIFTTISLSKKKPAAKSAAAGVTQKTPSKRNGTLTLKQKERTVSQTVATKYFKIPCIDENGKKLNINVKDKPVMFVSGWDSLIIGQLHQDMQPIPKMPVFVVVQVGPQKTSVREISDVKQILKKDGLDGTVVALDDKQQLPHQWITGDPDTYVWQENKLIEIPGPLLPNETSSWSKIFGDSGAKITDDN